MAFAWLKQWAIRSHCEPEISHITDPLLNRKALSLKTRKYPLKKLIGKAQNVYNLANSAQGGNLSQLLCSNCIFLLTSSQYELVVILKWKYIFGHALLINRTCRISNFTMPYKGLMWIIDVSFVWGSSLLELKKSTWPVQCILKIGISYIEGMFQWF